MSKNLLEGSKSGPDYDCEGGTVLCLMFIQDIHVIN